MAHRRALALLCCALVVASGATAVLATQSTSTAIDRTNQASVQSPAVLDVSQDRGNFTDPGVVVTNALAIGHQSIAENLTRETIRTRLSNAETERQRAAILANATEQLEQAVATLATTSRDARASYLRQELSTRAYSTRLAQIHARAESLRSTAVFIEDRAAEDSQVNSRAVELRARLATFMGPVRDRMATAVTEGGGPERVYIGAGENGMTSAVIEGGTYIREAMTPAGYDSAPGPIPEAEPLLENIRQQYPWVMNQSAGVSFRPIPIQSAGPQYAYWLTLTYPSGSVNAYIDTSTHDVYQEVQRIQLETLTATPDVTLEQGGRRLTVSRSFAGGPLKVNLTTTSGEPIAAQIRVNNQTVGQTGDDGVHWTISPATNYTITAVTADGEIRIRDIHPTG